MELSKRSPERSMVWKEPKNRGKVPVVYYLSRNGQLEHPHFMEVALSSSRGLHLRDVLDRLDFLRGKGMASMYSWSAKRNYKSGFVWHDLSDEDLIHPAHGNEYILKGSELLHGLPSAQKSQETSDSPEIPKSDAGFMPIRRKNTPWSSRSLDLGEYKVYKTDIVAASGGNADAATQTDDKRRRRRAQAMDDEVDRPLHEENPRSELGCDEISPPPSSSSPETVETAIKTDGAIINAAAVGGGGGGGENCHSGRFRASASAVVMHLISCGSFSLVPPYHTAVQRGASSDDQEFRETSGAMAISALRAEEKEYYSGSLVETKKKGDGGDGVGDLPVLQRSSSYDAERNVNGSLEEAVEKEADGVRGKCIPRKAKVTAREGAKRINNQRTLEGEKLTRVGDGEHVC